LAAHRICIERRRSRLENVARIEPQFRHQLRLGRTVDDLAIDSRDFAVHLDRVSLFEELGCRERSRHQNETRDDSKDQPAIAPGTLGSGYPNELNRKVLPHFGNELSLGAVS